jgi:hypothetical protein
MRESRLSILIGKDLARKLRTYISAQHEFADKLNESIEHLFINRRPLSVKGLSVQAPEGLKKELADLALNIKKDSFDFNILKKLKVTENELVERCLLINFKTNDELK